VASHGIDHMIDSYDCIANRESVNPWEGNEKVKCVVQGKAFVAVPSTPSAQEPHL
jgi:hypothetical protein